MPAFLPPAALPPRRRHTPALTRHGRLQMSKRHTARPLPPPSDPHSPESLGFLHIATLTAPHGTNGLIKARSAGSFATQRLQVPSTPRYLLLPGRRYPRPVSLGAGRRASQPGIWILRVADVRSPEHARALCGGRIYVKDGDRPRMDRGEFLVGELVGARVFIVDKEPVPAPAASEALAHPASGAAVSNAAASEPNTPEPNARETEALKRKSRDTKSAKTAENPHTEAYIAQTKPGRPKRARPPPAELKTGPAIGLVTGVITRDELCAAAGANDSSTSVANDVLEIALLNPSPPAGYPLSDVPDDATRVLLPFVKALVPRVDARGGRVTIDPPKGLFEAAVVNRRERPRPPRGLLTAAPEG